MAVLCINLQRSRHRWEHLREHVGRALPDLPLFRIEGVDGRALDVRDPALPLSPLCRRRLMQRSRVCHFMQIDDVGAVGCYQSHVRCWEWLLAGPGAAHPYALILEDDACLSDAFAREFTGLIAPRLLQPDPGADADPDAVDFCVLGYRLLRGGVAPRAVVDRRSGLTVYDRCCFEGGHCYAVTRRGAAVLRALAYPVQVHVDMLLGLTMELGRARGVVWPVSLATQCVGWWERGIGHADWGVGVKKFLGDVSLAEAGTPALLLGLLLGLCLVLALIRRRRRVRRPERKTNDHADRLGPPRTPPG